MIDYEVLFCRLLDYVIDEVGVDVEEVVNNISDGNSQEQEEIIDTFEKFEEERAE